MRIAGREIALAPMDGQALESWVELQLAAAAERVRAIYTSDPVLRERCVRNLTMASIVLVRAALGCDWETAASVSAEDAVAILAEQDQLNNTLALAAQYPVSILAAEAFLEATAHAE